MIDAAITLTDDNLVILACNSGRWPIDRPQQTTTQSIFINTHIIMSLFSRVRFAVLLRLLMSLRGAQKP